MKINFIIFLILFIIPFSCHSSEKTRGRVKDYIKQADTYSQQGAAAYGKFLFQFSAGKICDIYDLDQKRHIGQMTYDGSDFQHCDVVSFGAYKVDIKDEFPVIYVSGALVGEYGQNGLIWVYRIIHHNDLWELKQVQLIKTPVIDDVGICPDALLSNADGCMWIMGWNSYIVEPTKDGSGAYLNFIKFKTPRLDDGLIDSTGVRTVTLDLNDALTSFTVNNAHMIQQGACLRNQKVYVPYGETNEGYQGVDIVSLEEGRVVKNIDLMKTSVREPEAVFFYKGELYVADQATTIKKIINYKEDE